MCVTRDTFVMFDSHKFIIIVYYVDIRFDEKATIRTNAHFRRPPASFVPMDLFPFDKYSGNFSVDALLINGRLRVFKAIINSIKTFWSLQPEHWSIGISGEV